MDLEIRTIAAEEWEPWVAAVTSAFGEYPDREWADLERRVVEFDRTLGVLDGGRFVAGASTVSLSVTVPGGAVRMGGLTGLGVSPTHRRRGLATVLVRRHLEEVRDRGEEPVSGLWASESHIYARFGYGVAAPRYSLEIERERSGFAFPHEERGNVRLLERAGAFGAFTPVYDAARQTVPGMLERSSSWWEVRFGDFAHDREGASPFFYALHEVPEGADAYAVYRVKHDWSSGIPANQVNVEEVVASTAEGYAGIWRFLFDLDLTARIEAGNRPIDEPLWFMAAEPRRLRLTLRDGLWLRLVDVPTALAARAYSVEDALTIEVRDGFCPWNEGRYRLEGGPEGAACTRVDSDPDLALSVEQLGAAYLGWARFGSMLRGGRIVERTPGAVSRADVMFWHDPAPWCPHPF